MTKVLLLLVEDDWQLAQMYQQKLEMEGFQVDIAHDGAEGYEKMKLEHPGLVLMDIMMPNLNGLQALQKAKEDPATSKIPVVILTNLSGTADAQQAMKEGAVDYIVKSELTPAEVVDRVKKILVGQATPHQQETKP